MVRARNASVADVCRTIEKLSKEFGLRTERVRAIIQLKRDEEEEAEKSGKTYDSMYRVNLFVVLTFDRVEDAVSEYFGEKFFGQDVIFGPEPYKRKVSRKRILCISSFADHVVLGGYDRGTDQACSPSRLRG